MRKSDFEVFQALAKDSEVGGNTAQKEYSQTIPAAKPWEKVSGPPVLPPHLLQVILNKDTPLSVTHLNKICFQFSNSVFPIVRTNFVARAQSRNDQPFVCVVHQRWRHGIERYSSIPQKIRYHIAIQANLKSE